MLHDGTVEPLKRAGLPILLAWGEEDSAQPIEYARRFARDFPQARLVAVSGAGHIPMEDDPEMVGATLASSQRHDSNRPPESTKKFRLASGSKGKKSPCPVVHIGVGL